MTLRWAFVVDSVPFTKAVRDGETSLGGSESACLGKTRALSRRGHSVHVFATQLAEDAQGIDAAGVYWHRFEDLPSLTEMFHWDVFVGLRMPKIFISHIRARYRILWNQDLLNAPGFVQQVMAAAWQVDTFAYVSRFHQAQWEGRIPELKGYGWATRNSFDPADVPTNVTKDPNRVIYISRPERGLAPLLDMWPAFKARHPRATLQIARYSSMYDAAGWGEVCAAFDARVQQVNAQVGGVEYLGELNKRDLYRAIAEAAVMWYPGVPSFAETNCLAATEAQACGTPFVGSWKGALPETVPSGILIPGDAYEPAYQQASIQAASELLDGCQRQSRRYRDLQEAGRLYAADSTHDVLAAEWEAFVTEQFEQRYRANKIGVLRALLNEDDHAAAELVAHGIRSSPLTTDALVTEASDALQLCADVKAGRAHTAENYAAHSLDPLYEIEQAGRIPLVLAHLEGCTRILDVACGSGAYAIALAKADPTRHVVGVDFAEANIAKAKDGAERAGVADRVTFVCASVWDHERQEPSEWLRDTVIVTNLYRFDGLWVGEYVEHVADCSRLIDTLEQLCVTGAKVIYTCPSGPLGELVPDSVPLARGHVHHFTHEDLLAVWGGKQDVAFEYLRGGHTPAGSLHGGWCITYRVSGAKAGERNLGDRILKTRPRLTLSVGILAYNAEHDLGRCIESVWAIADEILVADTGSCDGTREIAAKWRRKVRVIDLPPVQEQPDGFAGARNAVLDEAKGDWFLWMDTDEVLVGSVAIPAYLETGGLFLGFALKQNHFQLDAPFHFDTPVRIFRKRPDLRFYGCVHEQPQLKDCNGDVHPALQLEEAQIAHFGYLTGNVRRRKSYVRNRPLLIRDADRFPDRRLGKVLWVRQLQQDADELAAEVGPDDPKVRRMRLQAVALFAHEFADPADKYHPIARPFYERALQALEQGYEIELALAGKRGGLEGRRAKPTRLWVRDGQELARLVAHRIEEIRKQMTPETVRVDPVVELSQEEATA